MTKPIPCPNPRCKQRFPPDSLQTGAATTCPSCGMTFRLRGAARRVPPPLPPPPVAAAAAPPPLPLPPSVVARGERAQPALVVSPVARYRRHRRGRFLRGLLIFLILAGAVGGVLYHYREELTQIYGRGDAEEQKAFQAQGNFSFRAAAGWRPDEPLRTRARAALAVSRKKPRGHLALYYRDYRTRSPGDGELLDQALQRLRRLFPQVEYEDPFGGENKGGGAALSGEPAIAFPFSAADADSVPIRGRCLMLTRRGYAYWLIFWGPEDYHDQLGEQWEKLSEGFTLHDERDGWKPTPRATVAFTGRAIPYRLDYAKDVWDAVDDHGEGAACELLLRGFEPTPDEEAGKPRVVEIAGRAAEVCVLALPPTADLAAAMAAVRQRLRQRHAEGSPELKIEPVTDDKTGQPLRGGVGAFEGQVEHLRLALAADNQRYARVAVARRPEGVLAVLCECRWDRRDYWEQEFTAVLDTARPAEGRDGR